MREKEILVHQLVAARAAIEAALCLIAGDGTAPTECRHEERQDISTMGHRAWRCLACGHIEEVGAGGDVCIEELPGDAR